jgi:hypothetical protein
MRALFVGGCADGKWEDFDDDLKYRRVIKQPKPVVVPMLEKFPRLTETIETEIYVKMQIQVSDVVYVIYIPKEMPPYEAFRLLINNYRPII